MCVKTVLPCERDLGNFYVPRCGDKPKPYSVQLITWWIITSWVTRIYSAKVLNFWRVDYLPFLASYWFIS